MSPYGRGTEKRMLKLLRGYSPVGVGEKEMQMHSIYLECTTQKLVAGRGSSKAGAGSAKRSWRMKQWLPLTTGGIKKLETELLPPECPPRVPVVKPNRKQAGKEDMQFAESQSPHRGLKG